MPSRAESALLERDAELAALESGLEDARRGAGRLVVIEGSAGIGKTRLLEEARDAAACAGMRVLAARGTELERDFPFALVRQAFEPALMAFEPSEREELLAGAARPAGPVVGLGNASADAGAPADPSFTILNALYWLTSNLAEAQPTLLAVDDVQWSDSPSLRFFRFLVPRLDDLPVVLAVAARPAEGDAELFTQLVADSAGSVIRPHELSKDAVAELVREGLSAGADQEFCLACHEASGGNPFMLHELLLELAADGSRGIAAEAPQVGEVAPATIQRAVLVRLARLPEPASRLARAVAVLGDDTPIPDAAELAELDPGGAADGADALAAADVIAPGRPLRFVHPLVRGAVYADLPSAARATSHRHAAALLSARGAEPERIAVHLLATDPAEDPTVVEVLIAAARRALDRAAPETAIVYLRRALAERPAGDVRLDLLRLLVRASFRAGDRAGFEELLVSGALEELTADSERLLESAREFAYLLQKWGSIEEIAALLERATQAATEAGDHDLAVQLQGALLIWTRQSPAEARARLDRFKDWIEPDSPGERLYLALQAWWGLFTGEPRASLVTLAQRAVKGGKIWGENPDTPVPAVVTQVLRLTDELDAAERCHDEYLSIIGSHGSWATATEGWEQGELAFLRGDVADAEAAARTAVEVSREGGFPLALPPELALLVEVLVERDDLAAADAELTRSGMTAVMPDGWWFGPLVFSRARLRLAGGQPREALEDLMSFGGIAAKAGIRPEYHPALSYVALTLEGVGDSDQAKAVAEQEVAGARAWGLPRRIGIALRTLGLLEGGERGLELLRESLSVLEPSPARLEHARTLAEYGAALRRANRRAEAREPLRTALEWARPAGALAVARRAHEELEATGEKLRPLLEGGIDSLTPSERRVAALAAEGHTNREIAQSLFLSVKTVEGHLSNAYRKLDVSSRRELSAVLAS
jgi:DNA-binding CsgD family transcriptional regulator/tetratricopeptide (TPR) repeat protein